MKATVSFKNCEKCSPSTFYIIQYLGSYRIVHTTDATHTRGTW